VFAILLVRFQLFFDTFFEFVEIEKKQSLKQMLLTNELHQGVKLKRKYWQDYALNLDYTVQNRQ
jgi:hypothetical protein